ncbi:hypothetical protein [Paractinoplanes atraurantiacus]|uniref:Capsular polysaccharide biosynthesis protein n=1 Tax=Paractinoplanes atraurantiacus TaxID=1036182 RepID=A0A285K0R8_9ACTN|nr:hypothetical protein [Actinoplanes atraurantiacus]SNY66165.1 hypothetical protein SAMN05421748_129111 [Actinoplanes atraurantiacus]
MDFWDLTKLMIRRWYVSVTLLLVTIAATGYAATEIKPDYAITSYVQLIPPTVASDPNKVISVQNPWLALGLSSLSNAATVATQDQTFLDALKKKDETASFEITISDKNPVAIIAVVAPTLEEAQSATTEVTTQYEKSVDSLQKQYNVKKADMITAYRLDKGENLKRPGGKVKRAVVVIFAIGILLTGGITILVDTLLRRRKRRKGGDAGAAPEMPPGSAAIPLNGTFPSVPQINRPSVNGDADKTKPLGQYARGGAQQQNGRDPGAETIVIPSMPRARQGGERGNDRGRRT